ncbi:MAG: hypothetical protein HY360_15680 [Verrucomicrobia bacterium]|nr:hypothetical protein [Verrucomicrobiota bacterium]
MKQVAPEDIRPILDGLYRAGVEAVIVGGQAINLWAGQYRKNIKAWNALLPYASEDLDCLGGKVELLAVRDIVGGRVRLNKDFGPSPNTGLILLSLGGGLFRIDFLGSVLGLNTQEIIRTSQMFEGRGPLLGLRLRVLHPVLCLESKTACLASLSQTERQDEKHLRLAILFVAEFLRERLGKSPRQVFNMIERIASAAANEDGLRVWHRRGIRIERAVPIVPMRLSQNAGLNKFLSLRWPQIQDRLRRKRDRYRHIMCQIAPSRGGNPRDRR